MRFDMFGFARNLYHRLPGSMPVKRRLRDAWLRLFYPGRLEEIRRYPDIPYVGDTTRPGSREASRASWWRKAEAELDEFLSAGRQLHCPVAREPRLSILIVVYNAPGLTLRCLESVLQEADETVEVILVDNGSDARTNALLVSVEGVTRIHHEENLHFIEGVNHALPELHGEFVLLLNNDALLHPAASNDKIGAVGPQVLSIDGLLLEAGCEIKADGGCYPLQRGEAPIEADAERPLVQVDYISGCFLLTRRALLEELGGLDQRYAPAYYDDADYCTELWMRGYRVVLDTRARITHFESAGSDSDQVARLVLRNLRRFCRKHRWRADHPARLAKIRNNESLRYNHT